MRRVFAGQFLALVSGCAFVVATVALDPTRFVEWFDRSATMRSAATLWQAKR
jgi:hypothetical protein